jgi:hypothetical protein
MAENETLDKGKKPAPITPKPEPKPTNKSMSTQRSLTPII